MCKPWNRYDVGRMTAALQLDGTEQASIPRSSTRREKASYPIGRKYRIAACSVPASKSPSGIPEGLFSLGVFAIVSEYFTL